MPDSPNRNQPDPLHSSTQPPEGSRPGTARLFPDVPPDLIPSSLERGELSDKDTHNASQAIEHLKDKMLAVSLELVQGKINQSQFQAVYTRYCEQKVIIERILAHDPSSQAWESVAVSGHTGMLRKQYAAHIVGMLVIAIRSATILHRLGEVNLPEDLLAPILSRPADGKIPAFEAGTRSTQIEAGRWLSVAPGELCASVVIFSHEPSASQIAMLTSLHRDFERANRPLLMAGPTAAGQLVFPQQALFDEP